jgi:hypothetical protein
MVLATAVSATLLAGAAAGRQQSTSLPVSRIEQALQAKGTVAEGVLAIGIDRDDMGDHAIHDVVVKPPFEINGSLTFQPLPGGRALFNGDMPLRASEVDRFIDALLANHLVFQAEHQHFYDLTGPVWFVHFRALGDPIAIAREVHAAIRTTSVHLPQAPPAKPRTPLDVTRLERILGSTSAEVGADGVVTVTLTRRNTERLGGVLLNQNANAETNIAFEPLNGTGTRAAAAPDFGMTADEIQAVIRVMRSRGWDIGCLYNQETAETPQLYFSHDFKAGDPYVLAREVRSALDRMNVK